MIRRLHCLVRRRSLSRCSIRLAEHLADRRGEDGPPEQVLQALRILLDQDALARRVLSSGVMAARLLFEA